MSQLRRFVRGLVKDALRGAAVAVFVGFGATIAAGLGYGAVALLAALIGVSRHAVFAGVVAVLVVGTLCFALYMVARGLYEGTRDRWRDAAEDSSPQRENAG